MSGSAFLGCGGELLDRSSCGCHWVEGLQFCLAPVWPCKVRASFRGIPKRAGAELYAAELFLKENGPMER